MKKETVVGAMLLILLLSMAAVILSDEAVSSSEYGEGPYGDKDPTQEQIESEVRSDINVAFDKDPTADWFKNNFSLTVSGGASSYSVVLEPKSSSGIKELNEMDAFLLHNGGFVTSFEMKGLLNVPESMFAHTPNLKKITLNEKGVRIGDNAFSYLSSLEFITGSFDGNKVVLTGVGESAFYGCTRLKSPIVLYGGDVGNNAFYNCTALESLKCYGSHSIGNIGDNAFVGCSNLDVVDLFVDGDIGASAFKSCTNLTSVHLSCSENTKIGTDAFAGSGKSSFADVKFSSVNIRVIPEGAFSNSNFTDYSFTTVGEIKSGAFSGAMLKTITVDQGTMTIYDNAFVNCQKMEKITINHGEVTIKPKSFYGSGNPSGMVFKAAKVKDIGADAFASSSLREFDVETVNGSIGESAFSGTKLIEFRLGNDSKNLEIGKMAFYNIASLTKVSLYGISSIGDNAFTGDTSLQTFEVYSVNKKVLSFGYKVFSNSTVSSIKIYDKDAVLSFSGESLAECSYLSTFTFIVEEKESPIRVLSIPDSLFSNCDDLVSLDITICSGSGDDTNVTLSRHAFFNCVSLTSLRITTDFDVDVFNVSHECAYNLSNLMTIDFIFTGEVNEIHFGGHAISSPELSKAVIEGANVSNVNVYFADNSFINNSKLENVFVFEGKQSILHFGNSSFRNAEMLHSVGSENDIVGQVGDYAFFGCGQLELIGTIKLAALSNDVPTIGERAFMNCSNIGKIVIESEGLWAIKNYAFSGCSQLQTIDLTKCESIGEGAFNKCSTVTFDTSGGLPDLKSLDKAAFAECSEIQTMNLLYSKITTVPQYLFSSCGSIHEVLLPTCVEKIDKMAFSGCTHLTFINFDECGNIQSIGEGALEKTSITNIRIPDGVKEIGEYAFKQSLVINVVLPINLEKIGAFAFEGCQKLKEITIPDKVNYIGPSAFAGCEMMESAILPHNDAYTIVGQSCFEGCARLSKIIIPASVIQISNRAFMSCVSLKSVDLEEGCSISLIGSEAFRKCTALSFFDCSTVKLMESYIFAECKNLQSVVMPESLSRDMGNSVFYECSSLTSITIPENVKVIGFDCFYDCTLLQWVEMPDSVTTIEKQAFFNCENLTNIYSRGNDMMLTSIGAHCFEGDKKLSQLSCDLSNITEIPEYAFSECKSLVFPKEYPAADVTSVGEYAFFSSGIVTVKINDSLQDLGEYAFAECANLQKVEIDMGDVTRLPSHIFENCALASFTFSNPSGSIEVGDYAFSGCKNLNKFEFNSITSLGEYAFANCWNIDMCDTRIDVDSIPDYAFYKCGDKVSTVGISDVVGIGKHSFEGCFVNCERKELYLEKVKFVDEYAFAHCEKLIIYIGEEVTRIQNHAFAGCDIGLEIISDKLAYIGEYAFTESQMTSVVVYGNNSLVVDKYAFSYSKNLIRGGIVIAKEVSDTVFVGCEKIEVVFIDDGDVDVINGVAYSKDHRTLRFMVTTDTTYVKVLDGTVRISPGAFSGWQQILEVELSDSVTSIGDHAFSYCNNLRAIYGMKSVHNIGNSAFENCKNLNDISLNVNLTTLGSRVFRNCYSMDTFAMSPSIVSIGNQCFENCMELSVIDLYSLTTLGDYVFSGCSELTTVLLPEEINHLGVGVFNNCVQLVNFKFPKGITEIPAELFMGCSSIQSFVVPEYIETIGECAFMNSGIKRITITDGVRTIEEKTFYRCHNLTELELSRNLVELGDYAFSGTAIQTITLPYGVKTVGAHTFESCFNLVGLTLRGSINTIGEYAFADCAKLHSVEIPSSVTEIGIGAFKDCKSMVSATLPINNTVVKEELFMGCESLRSVVLGTGTVTIEAYAFCDCRSLISIYLTENLESIGQYAFFNCESLISINIPINLEIIREDAYAGCISVKEITVDDYNTHFIFENGGLYSLDYSFKKQVLIKYIDNERTILVIDDSVIRIDSYAVYNCDNLKYAYIPAVNRIGNYCFCGCDNLREVNISTEIKMVGDYFLAHCPKLESIITGENNAQGTIHYSLGVLYCGDTIMVVDNSFRGVLNINEKRILAPGALDYARNITGFNVNENNPNYVVVDGMLVGKDDHGYFTMLLKVPNNVTSVTIPQGIKTVSGYAMSFCGSLTKIIVNDAVTFDSFAVYSSPALERIEINNGETVFEPRSISAGTASAHATVHIISDYDYSGKISGIFGDYTTGMIGYEAKHSYLPIIVGSVVLLLIIVAATAIIIHRRRAMHR